MSSSTPPPEPLHQRLLHVWRTTAERGEVALPPEPELATMLGVSRPNLREALARLEREGLISRRRGGKTVVNGAALEIAGRFDEQHDFAEVLRHAGFHAEVEVIKAIEVTLDSGQARVFAAPVGSAALQVTKRWLADGRPVRVTQDLVPLGTKHVPDEAPITDSIFDLVEAIHGDEVEWELAVPTATTASGELARWLQLDQGAAVLALEGIGVTRAGTRVLLSMEYHRPDVVRLGFIRIRR